MNFVFILFARWDEELGLLINYFGIEKWGGRWRRRFGHEKCCWFRMGVLVKKVHF